MARQSNRKEKKTKKEKSEQIITSGNILDYVLWRGDITLEQSPWNEIDSAIASVFSYANLGENELTFDSGKELRISDLAETDLLT